MAASQASWSDSPTDILWKIIERLSLADFVRFGGVCISWHNALAEKRCPPRFEAPWLTLFGATPFVGSGVTFFNLSEKRDYCMHIPEKFSQLTCIGYTAGWLVLSSKSEFFLFDPFSQDQKSLPSTTFRVHEPHDFSHVLMKVAVSQPQTTRQRSFIVGVLCLLSKKMAFLKDGDDTWTTLKTLQNRVFINITFYKDLLIGFCQFASVVAYDISGDPTIVFDVIPNPNIDNIIRLVLLNSPKYFVESSGHLLLVWRRLDVNSKLTTGVIVFKLDMALAAAGEATWVQLENLEDQALYLGPCQSHSVSANDSIGLKKNNVYFVDMTEDGNMVYLKAYDVRDRTSEHLPFEFDINLSRFPLYWFIPNYQ